ncbi:hypothetical protein GCM10010413_56010 [Promicromonospora sukumoe]
MVSGMVSGTAVAVGVATTAADRAAVSAAAVPTSFLVRDTLSSSDHEGPNSWVVLPLAIDDMEGVLPCQ